MGLDVDPSFLNHGCLCSFKHALANKIFPSILKQSRIFPVFKSAIKMRFKITVLLQQYYIQSNKKLFFVLLR